MNRRTWLATALAAGAAQSGAQTEAKTPSYYELRYYRMRTDRTNQSRRTSEFLTRAYLPAAKRAGAGTIGLFNASIAPDTPYILRLTTYPSVAAIETVAAKLAADADYQKALSDYDANPDAAYIKMDSWLLRALDFFPAPDPGPADAARPARTFEIRTYESQNESTMKAKAKMFASGEAVIFRASGLQPVFFGEAVIGAAMPHISYMLAFENLEAHDKGWAAFRANPDWMKLQRTPEFAAPGLVINISDSILTPLQGSEIR